MDTLIRSVRGLFAVMVIVVLLFGVVQVNLAAAVQPCVGDCPPLTGGVTGTCWDACVDEDFVGGDCTPSPPSECCCFTK